MLAVLVVLPALLTSCGFGASPRASLVVLIIVDTLRAESLPSYGYQRDTAPFLERLAEANVLFENVHSQSSCTFPSVNSLLASRYPVEFLFGVGARTEIVPRMVARPDLPTIAEVFGQEGYETVAISASPVVRAVPNEYHDGIFGTGFDRFQDDCVYEPAACVNRAALEVIAEADKPLFMYLHYFDPHDPYQPPPEHEPRYIGSAGVPPVRDWAAAGRPNQLAVAIDGLTEAIEYDGADVQHLVDLYDEEIRYLDGQLELFFDGLERLGRAEDAIVAIGADHGEQFLEHGRMKHCKSVYEQESRVPLVVVVPGAQPQRVRRAVQNLDITPTLLDAAGVRWRGRGFAGQSLLPLVGGPEQSGGLAYSMQNSQRALTADHYKVLLDTKTGKFRLYDLARDPAESRDLAAEEPELFSEMVERLRQMMALADGAIGDPDQVSRMLGRVEEQLRALGYLR